MAIQWIRKGLQQWQYNEEVMVLQQWQYSEEVKVCNNVNTVKK